MEGYYTRTYKDGDSITVKVLSETVTHVNVFKSVFSAYYKPIPKDILVELTENQN